MTDQDLETLALTLERDQNYRVIRRLPEISYYNEPDTALEESGEMRRGIFLDVETTGLDSATDQVIELALVPFDFAPDGRIFRLYKGYDALRDPGVPITPEITRLTGITDQMVSGKALDTARIEEFVTPAHLVVAHNAGFDRPFAEQIHPLFASKAWGCSMAEVPWRDEGLEGAKLEYLAYRYGFFYDAHRATGDCLAGIHLLAQELPESGGLALASLLANARRKTIRIWAEGSPFDAKDKLKVRHYRWNAGDDGRPKAWYCDVDESDLELELAYLRQEVFGGRLPKLPMDTITAFNRYSSRA